MYIHNAIYHVLRCIKVEPVPDWARKFTIPVHFSKATSEAIKSGVMTRAARVEVNNSLSTLMMVHTMRPSPDDIRNVCQRLVETYPMLKDSSHNGYVSNLTSTLVKNTFSVLSGAKYQPVCCFIDGIMC